jgi:hypothetical protein
MGPPTPSTSEMLGPNAESLESFLDGLEQATLAQLRAALARRSGNDYSIENSAHSMCLILAHRHERLAALELARLLAVRAIATAIATAMVEATMERLRPGRGGGEALDEAVQEAHARQEASELCQVLLEAAELAAEALVVRDLLPHEQFTLLTRAFAGLMSSRMDGSREPKNLDGQAEDSTGVITEVK